jgi:hypothetical protein
MNESEVKKCHVVDYERELAERFTNDEDKQAELAVILANYRYDIADVVRSFQITNMKNRQWYTPKECRFIASYIESGAWGEEE